MKTLKIYTILVLCLLGSTAIFAQGNVISSLVLQKAILENSTGEFHIIDKATHNGVRHNPESFTFIKNWFSTL